MTTYKQGAKALANVAAKGLALPLAEALAVAWVEESRHEVPVDTGQTEARTTVVSVRGSGVRGDADVQSDTPYAGYIEYGTRYVPPEPYWSAGRDEAVAVGEALGGPIETELRRALVSGGAWNPRNITPISI